jgi:hypothetical protein
LATARLRVVSASLWVICVDFGRAPASLSLGSGVLILVRAPICILMAQWKASTTRQPPMTKDELRLMLAEAVRNTQPIAEHRPKLAPKAEDDQH